jgi:hypothetical protein
MTVTLNITDTPPPTNAVTSFTLINADTDTDVRTLSTTSTETIDLAAYGFSIRANTNPATVGSVVFALDGNANYRLENGAPYAIFNNTESGEYSAWNIAPGIHTITATPYSGSNASGTMWSTPAKIE